MGITVYSLIHYSDIKFKENLKFVNTSIHIYRDNHEFTRGKPIFCLYQIADIISTLKTHR